MIAVFLSHVAMVFYRAITRHGLMRPLAQSDALLGIDLTIYNPSKDPGRRLAPRIVQLLADVLGSTSSS